MQSLGRRHRRGRVTGALLATLWLQGCMVGVMGVDAPRQSLAQAPPGFGERPVYVTVCAPSGLPEEAASWIVETWQDTAWIVLVGDYGLTVHEAQPAPRGPYVHLQLLPQPADSPPPLQIASGVISFLTFSLVPGYFTEPYRVEARVEVYDPPAAPVNAAFQYDYRIRTFVWLPLIVYPDVVASINGGFISRDEHRRGREQVMRRLAHDAAPAGLAASAGGTRGAVPEMAECPEGA